MNQVSRPGPVRGIDADKWQALQKANRDEWVKLAVQRPLGPSPEDSNSPNSDPPPDPATPPQTRSYPGSAQDRTSHGDNNVDASSSSPKRPRAADSSHLTPAKRSQSPSAFLSTSTPANARSLPGSLTSSVEEVALAKPWFGERISQVQTEGGYSGVEDFLGQVGGASMKDRFRQIFNDWKDPSGKAADAARAGYLKERDNLRDSEEYWLQTLCESVMGQQQQRFEWISCRNAGLPATAAVAHEGTRKPDGILIPISLERELVRRTARDRPIDNHQVNVGWPHIAVVVEFSLSRPYQDPTVINKKVAQLLLRLVAVLAEQSTRLWAWGLKFSGGPDNGVLDLFVLDREMVRVARLPKCWSDNFAATAALLSTFASATPAQLGYSPLFDYCPLLSPVSIDLAGLPPFYPRGKDVTPFPPPPVLTLQASLCNGSADVTPFSRATTVFDVVNFKPSKHYVVKISWVSDDRAGREGLALSRLNGVTNVPELVYAFSSTRLSSQCRDPPAPSSRRHLTIIVVSLPNPCIRLSDAPLSLPQVLDRFATLVDTLKLCEAKKVRHRDISTGNLLVTSDDSHQLVLNDFDCALILDAPELPLPGGSELPRQARTGTIDTASIAVLACGDNSTFRHLAVHDLESAVYAFWKVLAERLPIIFDGQKTCFGRDAVGISKGDVERKRRELWWRNEGHVGYRIAEAAQRNGLKCVLEVLQAIRRLKERVVYEDSGPNPHSAPSSITIEPPAVVPDYETAVEALLSVFKTTFSPEDLQQLESVWKISNKPSPR